MLLYHFYLNLYALYTEVMIILILINVQDLQNVVFSFEKDSNGQNHSLSDFYHPIKNPLSKISCLPVNTGRNSHSFSHWVGREVTSYPLTLFGKLWYPFYLILKRTLKNSCIEDQGIFWVISRLGYKSAPRNFLKFYFGLKHPKMTIQMLFPSHQCAFLLLKKCPFIPRIAFFFPGITLVFSRKAPLFSEHLEWLKLQKFSGAFNTKPM